MVEVKATPKFMRIARKIMTSETLQGLIDTLAFEPDKGPIIRNTGGIRKIRWTTGKEVGKARVLECFTTMMVNK